MQRLIFIDSDETLRRSDGSFSDRVKIVIKKLIERGHYVVICTGRPRYHSREITNEVGASPIVVSSNGSEIYDIENEKLITSFCIDIEECYKLVEYSFLHDLRFIVNCGTNEYVTRNLRNDNQILLDPNNYKEQLKDKNIFQCMVADEKVDEVEKMKELVLNNKNFELKNGLNLGKFDNYNWFTVGNVKASKGNALIELAKYLNIPIENTIAIGNDYNDISMLKVAGFSVCVDNAVDEVKKYADYITLSNDDDGVAIVLEKILEGEL